MADVRMYTEVDLQKRLAEQRQIFADEAEKCAIAVRRLTASDIQYIKDSVFNATRENNDKQ